jgi:hypothetical protein
MRKVGTVALALFLGFILISSCAKKRSVGVDLLDTCKTFKGTAKYVQFAVFPNACPDNEHLAAGDTTGARLTETVPATGQLPEIGDLPKSKFGLAVFLRDDECTVTAYGCTEADLDSISGVRIAVCDWTGTDCTDEKGNPVDPPCCLCNPLKGGGCLPPAQCSKGVCKKVPLTDGGACNLAVEKAGKLPSPGDNTQFTGPSITATDDGFVYGYRTQLADKLTAVVNFISDTGAPGASNSLDLQGCGTTFPTDGTCIAYEGGNGLFATSLPNCAGSGAGSVFAPFDSKGEVVNPAGPRNGQFDELSVAQGSCAAPATAAASGEFEFIYRVKTQNLPVIERVILQGTQFKGNAVHPFLDEDVPFAMVATSSQVRAFLAPLTSTGDTQILIDARTSDTINNLGTFSLPKADWAALTAWSGRVAAAVPASSGTTLGVWELSGSTVSSKGSNLVGSGGVQGAALAAMGSHLFMAQGKAGGITVIDLEDASGNLDITKAANSVDLPQAVGPVNLSTFDGKHIAMAAARGHVAVVWLTTSKPTPADPPGGWALLRCQD